MKSLDNLVKIYAREEKQSNLRLRRWSGYWTDWLLYVGFRSRGFVGRSFSNLILEILETVGIALCATITMTRAAAIAIVLAFVLHGLFEGINQAFRAAHLEERKHSWKLHLAVGLIICGIVYGYTFYDLLRWPQLHLLLLVVLFGCRAICVVVSQLCASRVSEISLKARIYFPPWINYLLIAACSLLIWITGSLPATPRFVVIVVGCSAARIFGSLLYLKQSKRAELEIASRNKASSLASAVDQLQTKITSWDLLRVLGTFAFFVVPAALTHFRVLAEWTDSVSLTWLIMGIWIKASERPLRAVYVDLFEAHQKRHWNFLVSRYSLAFKTGVWLLISTVMICVIYLNFSHILVSWLALLWLFLACLNHLYLMAKTSIAQDHRALVLTFGFKASQTAIILFFHGSINATALIAGMVVAESLLLVFLFYAYRNFSAPRAVQYASSQLLEKRSFDPANFLGTYPLLAPAIEKALGDTKLLILKFHVPVRSTRSMRRHLEIISKSLRDSDKILAIDPRTVLVWLPTATSINPIVQRIYRGSPLDFESHSTISSSAFFELVRSENKGTLSHDFVQSNASVLSTYLEVRVRMEIPSLLDTTCWVKDDTGDWTSIVGKASPELSQALFGCELSHNADVFPFRSQSRRVRNMSQYFYPFLIRGKIACIFVGSSPHSRLSSVLADLQKDFVRKSATGTDSLVEPEAFFDSYRVLKALSDRIPLKVEVSQKSDSHVISTFDGWKCRNFLHFSRLSGEMSIAPPANQAT